MARPRPRRGGGGGGRARRSGRPVQGRGGQVTVRITGRDRLRVRLEDLPEEIKEALRTAVRESAEAVRDDTRRRVPVDTGTLRDKVAITYEDGGLTAKVGWQDPTSYYATFVEHGTRHRPAQPSLHPALEAERRRARQRITEEVRRYLR